MVNVTSLEAFLPPFAQKQLFKSHFFLFWQRDILIPPVCFLFFFSQWIQSDPPYFRACNIHRWSIDCYSSGNYLKRESSCAFLMDCACLCLLYMDRELVWRSVILFSRSIPFWWGRISPVFTPYFSSSCRMTRLDDLESWWRWISLRLPSLFSLPDSTISHLTFHLKYPLFPPPNLFRSLIFLTRSDCDTLTSFIPLVWRVTVLTDVIPQLAQMC